MCAGTDKGQCSDSFKKLTYGKVNPRNLFLRVQDYMSPQQPQQGGWAGAAVSRRLSSPRRLGASRAGARPADGACSHILLISFGQFSSVR